MSLDQLHTKLLDSFNAGIPLTIEPYEMAELFNDIKGVLKDYDYVNEKLAELNE